MSKMSEELSKQVNEDLYDAKGNWVGIGRRTRIPNWVVDVLRKEHLREVEALRILEDEDQPEPKG